MISAALCARVWASRSMIGRHPQYRQVQAPTRAASARYVGRITEGLTTVMLSDGDVVEVGRVGRHDLTNDPRAPWFQHLQGVLHRSGVQAGRVREVALEQHVVEA